MLYRNSTYRKNTFDSYLFGKNIQGDILYIYDKNGNRLVSYTYDAWGNILSTVYSNGGASTSARFNPLRYRGYYYDTETGLYYLNSRYYDSVVGRWISPEPNVYQGNFDIGAGYTSYNIYVYCANNPIQYSDINGEFIVTAIIVGSIAGAVIGGTIGGISSYNSAKRVGQGGTDLFWNTAEGIGKGILIGGITGFFIGGTGGIIAAYGAGSTAGTAAITGTATIIAKTTEVAVLQIKKNINEGENGYQIASNCIDSIFNNGLTIIGLTPITKSGSLYATYLFKDISQHKVVPLDFNEYLRTPGGKGLSYSFLSYAWLQTIISIGCDDPVFRAYQRGYNLK